MGASWRSVRAELSRSDEFFPLLRLLVPLSPIRVQHFFVQLQPSLNTLLPTVAIRGAHHRQRWARHIYVFAAYTRVELDDTAAPRTPAIQRNWVTDVSCSPI